MKRKEFAISILIACLVLSMSLSAQSNSMSGTAKAEIRKPLTIIDDPLLAVGSNALDFGIVAPGSGAGTLKISTTNAHTLTGGVTLPATSPTAVASFAISGSAGKAYTISLGAASITINGISGNALTNSATMTVDAFTVRPVS